MSDSKTDGTLTEVCSTNDLSDGESLTVDVENETVVVFRLDGEFKALNNSCPHQGGPIGEGKIEDECVYCPWHGWKFQIETGEHEQGLKDATSYDVVVEDDTVYVQL